MKIRERCGQVARSIKANKQKRTGEKKKGREGKKKVSLDEECNRQEIKKEKKNRLAFTARSQTADRRRK